MNLCRRLFQTESRLIQPERDLRGGRKARWRRINRDIEALEHETHRAIIRRGLAERWMHAPLR